VPFWKLIKGKGNLVDEVHFHNHTTIIVPTVCVSDFVLIRHLVIVDILYLF
jgi:hypothetical protein